MSEAEKKAEQTTRRNRWLGWVVIVLAIIFIGQGIGQQIHQQRIADCNYRVSEQFRQQIIDSRETSNRTRQAEIELIQALRDNRRDADETQAAMDKWLAFARAQQAQAEKTQDQQLERCR